MDNASEAILIAGGILLAILTVSTLVVMFNNVTTIKGTELSAEEMQRLVKWNAEWEAYNRELLYDNEVLTVINKAKQNNEEYAGNDEYKVNVTIRTLAGAELNGDAAEEQVRKATENYVGSNKINTIYKCTQMKPNDDTGRIQDITFEVIK